MKKYFFTRHKFVWVILCIVIILIVAQLGRRYLSLPDTHLIRTIQTSSRVTKLAVSPDGQLIASVASNDSIVSIWRSSDGQQVGTLPASVLGANDIAFSPDGKTLAVPEPDGSVRLWEVRDGNLLRRLEITPHDTAYLEDSRYPGINLAHMMSAVAFSPDGTLIAAGEKTGPIWLWRVADGQLLATLQDNGIPECSPLQNITFSSDSQIVAVGCDWGTTLLWRVQDKHLLYRLSDPSMGRKIQAALNPSGATLATGGDSEVIQLWSVQSGQLVATLQDWRAGGISIVFSPDGQLLAAGGGAVLEEYGIARRSYDTDIRVWRVDDRSLFVQLQGHTDNVTSVVFSPDGQLLISGSKDGTIRIWRVQ